MKAFLLAVFGAFAIAAVSYGVLSQVQEESWRAFSTESVRVGDPGSGAHHQESEASPASQQSPQAANARE